MSTAVAVITGSAAFAALLGILWRGIRGLGKNADAWEIVKQELLANHGHSLIDRVARIEASQRITEARLAKIEANTASIDRKTPA